MSRFHQRLEADLTDKEFAAGYQEMEAELQLLHALEEARKQLHMTQEEVASRMGRQRAAVARLLSSEESNPTLDTLTDLLMALGITADITLRRSAEGEAPIHVTSAL